MHLRGKEYRLKFKKKTVSRLYFGKTKPDKYPSHPLMNSKGLKTIDNLIIVEHEVVWPFRKGRFSLS